MLILCLQTYLEEYFKNTTRVIRLIENKGQYYTGKNCKSHMTESIMFTFIGKIPRVLYNKKGMDLRAGKRGNDVRHNTNLESHQIDDVTAGKDVKNFHNCVVQRDD